MTVQQDASAATDDGLCKPGQGGTVAVVKREGEKIGRTLARMTLDPETRHAHLALSFGTQIFGDKLRPDIMETGAALGEELQKAMKGDLSLASRIYASQAVSLDTLFTELARRSGINMVTHPNAADRYMRLALKAQAACRCTLEALTRLHQPHEQTIKHVHVNDGGQAVVADHFHQHQGDRENGKTVNQSHATGQVGRSAALPCSDSLGGGVSIPGSERKEALQNARWDESGGT